jgi:hypothetical protein
VTDEEWIKEIKEIRDPVKMLQTIVDNEQYFGYDSYYADLREAMLKQAEKILSEFILGR